MICNTCGRVHKDRKNARVIKNPRIKTPFGKKVDQSIKPISPYVWSQIRKGKQ